MHALNVWWFVWRSEQALLCGAGWQDTRGPGGPGCPCCACCRGKCSGEADSGRLMAQPDVASCGRRRWLAWARQARQAMLGRSQGLAGWPGPCPTLHTPPGSANPSHALFEAACHSEGAMLEHERARAAVTCLLRARLRVCMASVFQKASAQILVCELGVQTTCPRANAAL